MRSVGEDKGVHSTVNVQKGPRRLWLARLFFSWEQGKVKLWSQRCQSPTNTSGTTSARVIRGSIPNSHPCSNDACRAGHSNTVKHERSPYCYPRLKLQEREECFNKKMLISCCCTFTLHQLSVIHTLLFEFRSYKWGNTLRVTCQVPSADDLWTDLL